MKSKIYVLTQGEYSDYGIFAMFSTKKKANTCLKDLMGIGARINPDINEWTLDDIQPFNGKELFKVTLDWESGIGEVETINDSYSCYEVEKIGKSLKQNSSLWHPSNIKPFMSSGNVMNTWCLAHDENHALKIGTERLAQMKAMNVVNMNF